MYTLIRYITVFVILNIGFFLFIRLFHTAVPFDRNNYVVAYHYIPDPRIDHKQYDFLKSLAVFDAQWYLRIAQQGYHKTNGNLPFEKLNFNQASPYNFFPLYPLLIRSVDVIVRNIFVTSFVFNNALLLIDFVLLYFLVRGLDNESTAIKTCFLLFFFPSAIFFRSFFGESLFLFFLLLFSYFLLQRRYIFAALSVGLMMAVKGTGIPLFLLLFYSFLSSSVTRGMRKKMRGLLLIILVGFAPLAAWMFFCYVMTGNPLIFIKVRPYWVTNAHLLPSIIRNSPFLYLAVNAYNVIEFPFLSWHSFNSSKIDIIATFAVLYLLIKSRGNIPSNLWWISFLLWLFPLLSVEYMSFTRLQIVSFPLFYYLAKKLNGWKFLLVFSIFTISLYVISLYFVNWVWVG